MQHAFTLYKILRKSAQNASITSQKPKREGSEREERYLKIILSLKDVLKRLNRPKTGF
jgi:hypothetical protein